MLAAALVVVAGPVLLATAFVTQAGAGSASPAAPTGREVAAFDGAPEVAVDGGSITGLTMPAAPGWSYRGIPFAAPPVGDRRWRPPQPVIPWEGVLPCTSYGPVCPQETLSTPTFAPAVASGQPQSEDCLYLNVDTPSTSLTDSLPVMVWIYGGSFLNGSGSAPLYDGGVLTTNGVVVVTFNYRLGPFGFFAHPDLTAESPEHSSGNYGLLDQIAALEWVQRNIAKFGGDPDNVTIFGESAGACSVLDLMCSPLTEGKSLFARAISESAPNADNGIVIYSTRPLATGEAMGRQLSKALGCAGRPDELAALRDVSTAELLQAGDPQQRLFQTDAPYTYQPYVDGWVLAQDPVEAFASGDFRHVPLVIGSNQEEANIAWPVIPLLKASALQASLSQIYGPYADRLYALFPPDRSGGLKQSLLDTVTLTVFTSPAQYFAKCVAAEGLPVYNYVFGGWPFGYPIEACHTAELPYVFGNKYGYFDPTSGNAGPLSAAMQKYWTAFATTGDPNGDGRLMWPVFSAASPATMMLQPLGLSIVQGYQAKKCVVAEQMFAPSGDTKDEIGPGVWATVSARQVRTGWWRSGVRVVLTASDGARGSGVRSIAFRKLTRRGAPTGPWSRYRGAFAVRGPGVHRFACRAVDKAGNVGRSKRFTVRIAGDGR
jgi:para-nitrobenzyl esterase